MFIGIVKEGCGAGSVGVGILENEEGHKKLGAAGVSTKGFLQEEASAQETEPCDESSVEGFVKAPE